MFRELLFYCFWAMSWFGFAHTLHKYSTTFRNYPHNVKNNIISFVHSILSVFLAGRYLTQTKHYANVFLYNQAFSNTSLMNVTTLNESLADGGYNYVNMLEIYNNVADQWSFTLLSLQAMSVCYFVADCIYIIQQGLIYKKAPYIFHHIMMILIHFPKKSTIHSKRKTLGVQNRYLRRSVKLSLRKRRSPLLMMMILIMTTILIMMINPPLMKR